MKMTYEGTGHLLRGGLAIVLLPLATSCALATAVVGEKTVGEQFREVMHRIDEGCKARGEGPYLDPKSPGYAQKSRYTDCDILKLKPYDPLATEEGRFAHALKLPPPHDKPEDVYRPGMSGEEYFKALCAVEAGEWVFKSVERVEGIVFPRPYQPEGDLLGHLFAYETIVLPGAANLKDMQDILVQPPGGRYNFMERKLSEEEARKNGSTYVRFFLNMQALPTKQFTYSSPKLRKEIRVPYVVSQTYIEKPSSTMGSGLSLSHSH
jgi:hypothetical protein